MGTCPTGAEWTARQVIQMRRQLEAAVLDAKGEIDITDAAALNTAARWERHALLTLRWLRQHCETMTHDQRLAYSRDIARASESRDRAIRSLGISSEARRESSLAALYADPLPADDPEDLPTDQSAPESQPEREGGEE